MDSIIKALAAEGNQAVLSLLLVVGGLVWLLRYLLGQMKDQALAHAASEKLNAEADLEIAKALTALRAEISRFR